MRSFLCASETERARLLDINRRLLSVEQLGVVLFVVAGSIGIPTFGLGLLLPIALAAGAFYLAQSRLDRWRRPELVLAGIGVFSQLMIAAGVALASGPRHYLLFLFAFPLVIASVVFPPRAAAAGAALTVALLVATAFAFDPSAVAATPPVLICPIVVMAVLTLTASAVRDLDVAARSMAIVDPLTGLLNRAALVPRAAELAHQAAARRAPVAMIVADIDRFKPINDAHGHAVGDAVLREVGYRLRKVLGPFEPVYRYGGEEFVVLLPDADAAAAAALGERLREAVAAEPVCGLPVTMSAGIAASVADEPFEFEPLFARADAALYTAKAAGRDRVRVGGDPVERGDAPARRASDRSVAPPLAGSIDTVDGSPRPRWLRIDQAQREHLLAMSDRLRANFRRCGLLSAAGILASAPWFGWRTLIAPAIAGAAFNVMQSRAGRMRRPELALAPGWAMVQIASAAGFLMASHQPVFALPMLLLMVIGSGAMFPVRFVVAGIALTALLMTVTALEMDAGAVAHAPAVLALPLALLGGVGLIGSAVQQSAVHHRGTRIVDPLTGLLNRAALDARVAELAHQAALTGERVSVVIGDIDRFKAINDSLGHARGDATLTEIAVRIRRHVRTFESVYRFGGDEIVLVLAGVDAEAAAQFAERLRDAIAAEPVAGAPVAMSFGVAASPAGGVFDYHAVFARADTALYEAKRSGGGRVRVDAPAAAEPIAA